MPRMPHKLPTVCLDNFILEFCPALVLGTFPLPSPCSLHLESLAKPSLLAGGQPAHQPQGHLCAVRSQLQVALQGLGGSGPGGRCSAPTPGDCQGLPAPPMCSAAGGSHAAGHGLQCHCRLCQLPCCRLHDQSTPDLTLAVLWHMLPSQNVWAVDSRLPVSAWSVQQGIGD